MTKLTNHLKGKGLPFTVNEKTYALRAPLPAERDEANRVDTIARRFALLKDDELYELSKLQAPESELKFLHKLLDVEIDQMRAEYDEEEQEQLERRITFLRESINSRTAADSILSQVGSTRRSRYLAKQLLVDDKGKPLDIDEMDIDVQEAAKETAEKLWDDLGELPFLSEALSEQK